MDLIKEDLQANNNKSTNFKLIMMDCQMPVMDGYDATVNIKRIFRDLRVKAPTIIAITGHTEPEYIKKA